MQEQLMLYPMINLDESDLRSMLFPALFEEENNLIKLQELVQFVQQKDLMKKLFLIKIYQNFDLKSSNMYRNIAEQIGLNLNEEEIKESIYFEQSQMPSFYQYIEEQENPNKLKRSSSFSSLIDCYQSEEKNLFFEIQNTFFGRIPLYVKAFLGHDKQAFEFHNSLNHIILMESNPFDLPSIYTMINEVCSFLKCEYALNLFLSIQDFKNINKINNPIFTNDLFTFSNLECSISNSDHNLLIELIQSILLGQSLNQALQSSFTKQQIYFAFFLTMHIMKICTISFGIGLKNEFDLGTEENNQHCETSLSNQIKENFEAETVLCKLYNENNENSEVKDNQLEEENSNQKSSELTSHLNLTTNSISYIDSEEEDIGTDIVFEEMDKQIKSASKYSNIVNLHNIEYQEFFISSIEPFLNSNLTQIIDKSYKYIKNHESFFQKEANLNKESLYGYIQCLLHIKNYQFNPKTLEDIPNSIKKFIKCLVFNPHKLDLKLVSEIKQILPSFELYSEFVEYISECIIFANLTIFQHQNQL